MWRDVTTSDLLEKWREATRAAELARRLAAVAQDASMEAEASAVAYEEIAKMAENTAAAAEQAAATARRAADRAVANAKNRAGQLTEAQGAESFTGDEETGAREAYHEAERQARDRHGADVKN